MEDATERLRELNGLVPVPLELPEEELLVEIEEELLIGISAESREFLLPASDVTYGRLEPMTVIGPYSHTYLPEAAATAWDPDVPHESIPLCEDDGSYYCVVKDGEVALWADGDLTDESWDSVWVWVRDVWLEN